MLKTADGYPASIEKKHTPELVKNIRYWIRIYDKSSSLSLLYGSDTAEQGEAIRIVQSWTYEQYLQEKKKSTP